MPLRQQLTPLQFAFLLFNTALGAGLLTLPRHMAQAAREDMWLSVLAGGVITMAAFWCAATLCGFFPRCTLVEYHRVLLGRWLGDALTAGFLALSLLYTALALRTFTMAVKVFLFDMTPTEVILFALLALAMYATQYGLGPLVRLQQILLPGSMLLFLVIFLLGLLAVKSCFFLPVLGHGVAPVLQGVSASWLTYSGQELVIVVAYPFLTHRRAARRWGLGALATLTVMYTFGVAVVQGILGAAEITHLIFPTISAFKEVEIPETFVERLDGYLMVIRIFLYFGSLANLLMLTSFAASRLLGLEFSRPLTALLLPVLHYTALVPPSLPALESFIRYTNLASLSWGLVITPLLTLLAYRQREVPPC